MINKFTTVEELAAHFKAAARSKGFTQKSLASISGVPETNIAKFFSDQTKRPDLFYVAAMAKALDISLDDIFDIKTDEDTSQLAAEIERINHKNAELTHKLGLQSTDVIKLQERVRFHQRTYDEHQHMLKIRNWVILGLTIAAVIIAGLALLCLLKV